MSWNQQSCQCEKKVETNASTWFVYYFVVFSGQKWVISDRPGNSDKWVGNDSQIILNSTDNLASESDFSR